MKIVLVSVSSNAQLSGVSRHVANLARCLLAHSDVETIHLVAAPWERTLFRDAIAQEDTRLHIHSVYVGSSSFARNLWFWADLPSIADQLQADIVHLGYPAPLHRRKFRCPTVVSVHDLYPWDIPENWGFPKVFFNRIVFRQCVRAADALACVSDATLSQLRKRKPARADEKARRVYNCVEPAKARVGRSPLPGSSSVPFFLCVAQHRRNKNILLALRILVRLLREKTIHPETRLVIVGISGPETANIHRFIEEAGIGAHVILLSGIMEAELQWCYRNCVALLAPSLTEGFGLPVAEALLAGCRVVCSDIRPFRELGDGHCQYFSLGPDAEENFATAVRLAISEPRRGPVALPQLSGLCIAGETMTLYRALAGAACRLPAAPEPEALPIEKVSL
ncbi:MAG: glycosyltransferase family 1 protein [Acidobacteriaceae bacterium]